MVSAFGIWHFTVPSSVVLRNLFVNNDKRCRYLRLPSVAILINNSLPVLMCVDCFEEKNRLITYWRFLDELYY